MNQEYLNAKMMADNLRMIADAIEYGYPLQDVEKQMVDSLISVILLEDANRPEKSKIEKVDLAEQETKDIEKAIESIERLKKYQMNINPKRIDKMTGPLYEELSEKADKKIDKDNRTSSEDLKTLKLTRFR